MPTIAEAFQTGLAHHQAGHLQQAEAIYRQILQVNPNQADALHFLGVIANQVGRHDVAVDFMKRSVELVSHNYGYHCNLGLAYQALGRLDEAVASFHNALRINPNLAEVHNNLGNALLAKDCKDEAVASFDEALRINPQYANAHYNRANVLMSQDKLDQAVAGYRRALQFDPHSVKTLNNLGSALNAQGQVAEAVECYREALRIDAHMAEAHHNLGNALARLGRWDEAVTSLRQALRLKPDHARAHHALGMVLADQNAMDEAIACLREAARLDPDFTESAVALSVLISDQAGRVEEALACLEQAMRHRPTDRLRIVWATRLPVIYQSKAEVAEWRNRLVREVRQLRELKIVRDLTEEVALNLFYPPFQGLDDCSLQAEVAQLYRAPGAAAPAEAPAVPQAAPVLRKIRVGLVSSLFKDHTIGHLTRGLVAQLARDEFAVTVLSVGRHRDAIADFFTRHADCYLEVPRHLPSAPQLIAEQNLDVLLYTDIGMDPITYTLAFSRLAPVQCATWGHPVTTGLSTIDYFISAEDLETEESDQHYTERLIRLKTLPIYYYRPDLPVPPRDRQHFGLPAEGSIYACPQTLFKFHPDFDEVLGGILRSDPSGTLVLIKPNRPHWEHLLRQRFSATLSDVADRIRFLPQLDRCDFVNLLAISDVLLDPLHFGGGNSSYEGLAMGTPIVTLPSRFLRGRITYALYRQMKILECVAANPEDYIRLAVHLGTDAAFRHEVRQKILAANGVLYENKEGIRKLEQFFQQAVRGNLK